MTLLKKPLVESIWVLQRIQVLRFSTSLGLPEEELKNTDEKKLLKVAMVGRPNAGKSTLINGILKLNLCGVSHKSHTTKAPFKAAFTHGNTQIVFVDTPGLVTQKEYNRFNLSQDFLNWKKNILNEVDIIGIVHEVCEPRDIHKFHLNLIQNINDFMESKPMFLVLNKVDLVLDKEALTRAIEVCLAPKNVDEPCDSNKQFKQKLWRKFSKIFFTSALRNEGINDVSDYLLEQAKPGDWLFEPGQVFEKPLHILVTDLLRAQMMDILPSEIPYQCKYEVEYLKENKLGEIICVSLITCKYKRHVHLITSGKKRGLRSICKQLESDLYKISGKVFKMRLVVQEKK